MLLTPQLVSCSPLRFSLHLLERLKCFEFLSVHHQTLHFLVHQNHLQQRQMDFSKSYDTYGCFKMSNLLLGQLGFKSTLNLLLVFVSGVFVLVPRFDFLFFLFLLNHGLSGVLNCFLLLVVGGLHLIIVTAHFFHPVNFCIKHLLLFLVCSVMRSIIFNYNNYKSIYRDTHKIRFNTIIK